MKYISIICLFVGVLLFAAPKESAAQYDFEAGIKLGGANYLGDIGGKSLPRRDFIWDMHLNQTNVAIGAYGRYRFSRLISVAANITYLQINDYDSESTNPARRARNLHFRNRMVEFGGRGEVTIFYHNDVGGRGFYNPKFKLYGHAGLSVFRHNPQAQLYNPDAGEPTGEWVDLRPLRTEGQDSEYETFAMAVPLGIGLHFTFNNRWRLGWEMSWRMTFTDYLDDISTDYANPQDLSPEAAEFASQTSQEIIDAINDPEASGTVWSHQYDTRSNQTAPRGEASNNDNYLTMTFSVGYVFRGRSSFYKRKYNWIRQRRGIRRSRAKF
ncbi:DUF6089 family protein [Halocola ammonii]